MKKRNYKHGPITRDDEHLKLLYQAENAIEKAMEKIRSVNLTGGQPLHGEDGLPLVEMLRDTKRVCMSAIYDLHAQRSPAMKTNETETR